MDQAGHTAATRAAYDALAPIWSAATDDNAFNAHYERPAVRALVPRPLEGRRVLDAGCGSGALVAWLRTEGAEAVGVDLSPAMVEEARRRCPDAAFEVADLGEPLPFEDASFDGITCSMALHYLRDWSVPLSSFRRLLRPGGWVVVSSGHPAGPPPASQRLGYFATELLSETWEKSGVTVTQHFWRRPLAAVVGAFADAGFTIDRVGEPQVSDELRARFPREAALIGDDPWFIVYRLRIAS